MLKIMQKAAFVFISLSLLVVNAADDTQFPIEDTKSTKMPSVQRRDTTIEHGVLDRAVISIPFYGVAGYQLLGICTKLSAVQMGGGLFAGWLIADFVSGAVHAVDDMLVYRTFTNKAIPVEQFIRKNDFLLDFPEKDDEDDHHKFPSRFTQKSYWYTARIYHLMAFPALGITALLAMQDHPLLSYTLLYVTLMGANNHLFHAVAHGGYKGNSAVATLQKYGLLLGTKHHAKHHQGDHERNFCIISGWMDCVLNPTLHYVVKPTISAVSSTASFFRKWCGKRESFD